MFDSEHANFEKLFAFWVWLIRHVKRYNMWRKGTENNGPGESSWTSNIQYTGISCIGKDKWESIYINIFSEELQQQDITQ